MEANRDAAAQSLNVANRALAEGDRAKALRFAEKSVNLYPTDAATKLVLQLQSAATAGPSTSAAASPAESQSSSAQSRPVAAGTKDLDIVQRIERARTYYEVIGVEMSADETMIRKAYRKLAALLHPDKNSATGAEDAFKKVLAWS